MLCNPGTHTGWSGGTIPQGTPVLLGNEPAIYEDIVAEAMAGLVSAS